MRLARVVMGIPSRSHAGCDCRPMGASPIETKKVARPSASCRDQCLVRMLAEMRKHPGGSELNVATFAAVQPGSLRCSAFIERAPCAHQRDAQTLCYAREY
jgi:hypothetical protein